MCRIDWTDKIARKMQASKEVWGKIFGTISTREKFLDMRLELAKHEWARLKANDMPGMPQLPLGGRNGFHANRRPRARTITRRYLLTGEAHLHRLPQGHRA